MTCAGFDNMLLRYIDGSLRPDQRAAVDIHLIGCEECSGYFLRYCKVVSLLAEQRLRREPQTL